MKVDTVLTAVNGNLKYTKLAPLFINSWRKLYPHVKICIVFIGDALPENLFPYAEFFVLFPELPGISSVFIAQTIRLLYPAVLENRNTLITDIDMLPGNSLYFSDTYDDKEFVVFRPLSCVDENQIAICYNLANTSIWQEVFNIKTIENIKQFLTVTYSDCDGIHGGIGWWSDQLILFKYLVNWNKNVRILNDNGFFRLDFFHHLYDLNKFAYLLNTGNFSDAHIFANNCTWNEDDINLLLSILEA